MQIGLDIGGTFTDIVALDGDGRLALTKVPSTPKDLLEGIGTATRSILGIAGAEPRMVLGRVPSITALRTDDGRVWPVAHHASPPSVRRTRTLSGRRASNASSRSVAA